MAHTYEIKVSPNYTGQTDPNCTYKWCWYIWDPTDHTDYVAGDLVHANIGTSPDTSSLLITTAAPSTNTTYSVQLIVKENTLAEAVVCISTIQQVVVQSTICDEVCECVDGATAACGLNNNGIKTCVNGGWGDCVDPDACVNGTVQDCTGSLSQTCTDGQWGDCIECVSGATAVCGINNNGIKTCTDGLWGDCVDPDVCVNGTTAACGNNNSGLQTCTGGQWESCTGADECVNGATQSCTGGTQTCAGGTWGDCIESGVSLFHFDAETGLTVVDMDEVCNSGATGAATDVTLDTAGKFCGAAALWSGGVDWGAGEGEGVGECEGEGEGES